MSTDPTYRDILYGEPSSKACAFPGCDGTMRFNAAREEASAPHTLEWPWYATWVCGKNPAHIQIASAAEESRLAGRANGRRR